MKSNITLFLQLLDAHFADHHVRTFAVKCLEVLSDDELILYLPQLVQVLKYENDHINPLTKFLLERALRNRLEIGHLLFWLLKSELHNQYIQTRYCLLLEAYLVGSGRHLLQLAHQVKLSNALKVIAINVHDASSDSKKTGHPFIPIFPAFDLLVYQIFWSVKSIQLNFHPLFLYLAIHSFE